MTSLEMYREHILDLYKHPHNFGIIEDATYKFDNFNYSCGDKVTIYLKLEKNRINDAKFNGQGCAISIASASILTDIVKGKTLEEVKKMSKEEIIKMLNIPISYSRVKCALLCFDALKKSLEK